MKKALPLPSKEELDNIFYYEEGKLFFKNGTVAGRAMPNGYLYVKLGTNSYSVSRIIWKMSTGVDPKGQIDHKDRNRQNNAIANLRDVTQYENMLNTKCTGVSLHKSSGRYRARMMHKGKDIFLGYFKTKAEAVAHRKEFKELYMEMVNA